MKLKVVLFAYLITVVAFFFYSFTQIDLGLTFARNEFLRGILTSFQYIGYFDRPLSTFFYLGILLLLFVFYLLLLRRAYHNTLSKKIVWKLCIVTTIVLAFSYNAFSYDLFNYIFDAKIVTEYQQNPYVTKALDFPTDPMLSFMHWTHRTYPYGPVWLGITIPLSFIGFGFFLPTLYLFKALMAASFLGSLYFIGKIFQKIAPKREVFALVFFGLQPLVLVESLVSAHLDIVMMFFSLWAFWLLIQKRFVWAFVLLFLSIGIKFATAFLLPVFVWYVFTHKKKMGDSFFLTTVILLLATVVIASLRTNFQPWYLVPVFSFAVFLAHKYWILIPSLIVSFCSLLLYVPYLYLGNWDPPVPNMLSTISMIGYVLSLGCVLVYLFIKNFSLLSSRNAER